MDVNIFKRNVALHELGIGELSYKEKKVYDYLLENLTDLKKTVNHEHIVLSNSNDDELLVYYITNKHLYIGHDVTIFFLRNDIVDFTYIVKWFIQKTTDIKEILIVTVTGTTETYR